MECFCNWTNSKIVLLLLRLAGPVMLLFWIQTVIVFPFGLAGCWLRALPDSTLNHWRNYVYCCNPFKFLVLLCGSYFFVRWLFFSSLLGGSSPFIFRIVFHSWTFFLPGKGFMTMQCLWFWIDRFFGDTSLEFVWHRFGEQNKQKSTAFWIFFCF